MRDYISVAVIAYLCGSIPFGLILVWFFQGKDIRKSGSGNIGATNVARTAPGLGIATLLLDAAKGYAPVRGTLVMGISYDAQVTHLEVMLALAAFFAVAGHLFPVWLKFRGGKGVATAVGVYLALAPAALGLALIVFVAMLAAFRYVSLSSIASAAAIPALAYWLRRDLRTEDGRPLLVALIVISILIIAKHHANLRRLLGGTENRFGRRKNEQQPAAED